jgi:hypothetical protein
MRRLLFGAAVLSSAACFAPRPCTLALCPAGTTGSYTVTGWDREVASGPDSPRIPIVSNSEVKVTDGTVEFVNGKTVLRASAGTTFRFTAAVPKHKKTPKTDSTIAVSSGSLTVSVSTEAAKTIAAGSSFVLPPAK